jgi:hypothetical protein
MGLAAFFFFVALLFFPAGVVGDWGVAVDALSGAADFFLFLHQQQCPA